jgi:hypothetical protein
LRFREKWGRLDWLALLALLLLAVLVWSRVLFQRGWSFGVELDFLRQFYPARYFAANSLGHGIFPLWNPYLLSGQPFLASYQTALLYPVNLLMLWAYGAAGAAWSLKAQVVFSVFHLFLAGAFTYLLARDLKLRRVACITAAVAFMFCGYLVAHAGHLNQLSAAAWIPLVFLLFKRSLDRRSYGYAVWAGLAFGVALLAGHLQPLFYMGVVLFMLVIYSAIQRRGDPRQSGFFFGLLSLVIMTAVGAAVAAAQLLPTYQMITLSSRSRIPYDLAATYSLPRRQVLSLVFPHFWGSSPTNYFGMWKPGMWEMYGYTGVVAGALGVIALMRKRKGFVIFLWIILLLSVLLAVGPGGYLWTALFKSHILFDRFRDPARSLVIFGLATALLAGFGADTLAKYVSEKREKPRLDGATKLVGVLLSLLVLVVILATAVLLYYVSKGGESRAHAFTAMRSMIFPLVMLAALLALLTLARRSERWRRWTPAVIVLLVLVDLVAMNVPWTMVKLDWNDLYHDRQASLFVASQKGVFRAEPDALTMYPSLDNGALYNLEKASGDDSLVLETYYRYRELLVGSISPGVQPGLFHVENLRSQLLDLMNDTYFMSRDLIDPSLTKGKFSYLGDKGGVRVYKNLTAMPRAWMSDATVLPDQAAVLDLLSRTQLNGPDGTALLGADDSGGLRAGDTVRSTGGTVTLVSSSPNGLKFETPPSCRGLLVVSEVDYPGWEVYVDGKKKQILTTDYLFRGVMLSGGQKSVEFKFRPGTLKAGAAVSITAVCLLLAYAAVLILRRRRVRRRAGALEENS